MPEAAPVARLSSDELLAEDGLWATYVEAEDSHGAEAAAIAEMLDMPS